MKVIEVEEPDDNNYEQTGQTVVLSNTAYVKVEDEKSGLIFTVAVPFTLHEMYTNQDNVPCAREVIVNTNEAELSDDDPEIDRWESMVDWLELEKKIKEALQ